MLEEPVTASAQPRYVRWETRGLPAVVIRQSVADSILKEVLNAFNAVPRRGAETGGLLLGTRTGDHVRVEDFEPVRCEHRFGPSYLLSDEDRVALEETLGRLRAGPLDGLSVVGFYRSHTRPDFALDAEDGALFADYFADPAQVFLLIKPNRWQESVADFFFWRDGGLRQALHLETFPFVRGWDPDRIPEAPAEPRAPEPPASTLVPAAPQVARSSWQQTQPPADAKAQKPESPWPRGALQELPPRQRAAPVPKRFHRWNWGAVAALALILAGAFVYPSLKLSTPDPALPATSPAPTSVPPASLPDANTPPADAAESPAADRTSAVQPPPSAEPEKPAESASQPEVSAHEEIDSVLDRWSGSMRRGDVRGVLNCYASRISPYLKKRNARPADVRKRLEYQRGRYGKLAIHRISDLQITELGAKSAAATFVTHWETAGAKKHTGEDRQRITLVRTGAGWKIAGEEQTRVY